MVQSTRCCSGGEARRAGPRARDDGMHPYEEAPDDMVLKVDTCGKSMSRAWAKEGCV